MDEKTLLELEKLRSDIRSQMAQEYHWEAQRENWAAQERHWHIIGICAVAAVIFNGLTRIFS